MKSIDNYNYVIKYNDQMIQNIQEIELLKQFNKTYSPMTWLCTSTYFNYLKGNNKNTELIGELRNNVLISACIFTITDAKRGRALEVSHGPIIPDYNAISYRQYLDYLKNIAKQKKCDFIRINSLSPRLESIDLVFKTNGFITTPFENMFQNTSIVDIKGLNESSLLELYSEVTKEHISNLLTLEKNGEIKIEFSNILEDDCKPLTEQQSSEQQTFESIQDVTNYYGKENQGFVAKLYYKNILSAYQTFIFNNKYICNHHGAVIKNTLELNLLIHFKSMLRAIEMGIEHYDFWGTAPMNSLEHPWKESTNLKIQLGGKEHSYISGYDFPLTPKYWLTNMYEKYQKIKRGH